MLLYCEDSQIPVLVLSSIDVSVVRENKMDVRILVKNNMKRKGKDVLVHNILSHNSSSMFGKRRRQSIKKPQVYASLRVFSLADTLTLCHILKQIHFCIQGRY